jgi:hypothetical protein
MTDSSPAQLGGCAISADRSRGAGALRPDATGTDLIFLQAGLNAILNLSRDAHPALYRRYLHLALDSLRVGPDTPLRVPALTTEQTHTVMGPSQPSRATPAADKT